MWNWGLTYTVTWSSTKPTFITYKCDITMYNPTFLISFHIWKIFIPICNVPVKTYTGHQNVFRCLLFSLLQTLKIFVLTLCACCLVDLVFSLSILFPSWYHMAIGLRVFILVISSLHESSWILIFQIKIYSLFIICHLCGDNLPAQMNVFVP